MNCYIEVGIDLSIGSLGYFTAIHEGNPSIYSTLICKAPPTLNNIGLQFPLFLYSKIQIGSPDEEIPWK
jgi:hypothetical protein